MNTAVFALPETLSLLGITHIFISHASSFSIHHYFKLIMDIAQDFIRCVDNESHILITFRTTLVSVFQYSGFPLSSYILKCYLHTENENPKYFILYI